jgi:hypothetical protein
VEPVLSFATIAEADAYNEAHLFGEAWAPLSGAVKARALFTATQIINNELLLAVVTDGSVDIPQSLKNATAEYARILATTGDPTAPSDTEGLKSLTAGSLKLEFAQRQAAAGTAVKTILPAHVIAMVAHLIVDISMLPLKNV